MFKIGQKVVVLAAYYGGSNAPGVIVGKSTAVEHRGKWLVDIGDTTMPVEDERLVDEKEYWDKRLTK